MLWRSLLGCALLVGCAASQDDIAAANQPVISGETTPARYTLAISPSVAPLVDEAFIRREVDAAIDLYTREVAPLSAPIPVLVDARDCLRTGYDMPSRKVFFCNNTDTPRAGTASADVIHHEMFHALLCQTKPDWCGADAPVPLHEGLADYFAYLLAPDDLFGEGFYEDQAYVRRYRVPYCYSLVGGGHEKGNAIATELIARGHGLSDVARLVQGDALSVEAVIGADDPNTCFSPDHAPAVERTVEGYPASTLERYRIQPGAPLTIRFAGDAAFTAKYPSLHVRWDPAPAKFAITSLSPTDFQVAATGADGYEKVAALYEVDGQVIGGKAFYFQVAHP